MYMQSVLNVMHGDSTIVVLLDTNRVFPSHIHVNTQI